MEPGLLRKLPSGHSWASEEDLLAHAKTIEGHTAAEIAKLVGINLEPSVRRGRTGVGDIAQRFVGKASDSAREPDIPELGIEIKSVPLKRNKTGWTVKEPTSITLIDPDIVLLEPWKHAYVVDKLAHILWFPFEHDEDVRKARFLRPFSWRPNEIQMSALGADYENIRHLLRTTPLADLSESLSHIMGARRKDKKGGVGRAWAFKARFTKTLILEALGSRPLDAIADMLGRPTDVATLEARVEERLGKFVGRSLSDIASATGAKITGGKAGPANFVRALLGVRGKGGIKEFEEFGIRIHTAWADPVTLTLHESISFPRMSLKEFASEEWGDSELLDHVDRILFIPLLSRERDREARILGRPFFWSPSGIDLAIIRKEWLQHQEMVNRGLAKYEIVRDARGRPAMRKDGKPKRESKLPRDTLRIHMRPHALTAADEDIDPLGNRVTGQSFWLNGAYVSEILSAHKPLLSSGGAK